MSATMAGGDMSGGSDAGMVHIPQYILDESPTLAKRLKNFQEAEDRAKKATELIGTAEEIAQLRDQAKVERDAADEASAETKEVCAKLVSEAIAEAEDIVEEARSQASDMTTSAENKLGIAQQIEDSAQLRAREAKRVEEAQNSVRNELDRRHIALELRSVELEEKQQQLLQEKSKLATVREQIESILG